MSTEDQPDHIPNSLSLTGLSLVSRIPDAIPLVSLQHHPSNVHMHMWKPCRKRKVSSKIDSSCRGIYFGPHMLRKDSYDREGGVLGRFQYMKSGYEWPGTLGWVTRVVSVEMKTSALRDFYVKRRGRDVDTQSCDQVSMNSFYSKEQGVRAALKAGHA